MKRFIFPAVAIALFNAPTLVLAHDHDEHENAPNGHSADQILRQLEDQGYHVTDIDYDDDDQDYEVSADREGYEYDLNVDPQSGEITRSEREPIDNDDDQVSGS